MWNSIRRTSQTDDLRDMRFGCDKAADPAIGLAQRAHVDQTIARDAEMLGDTAAVFAENAGAVRIVDIKRRIITLSQLQQIRLAARCRRPG